jgi:hypothetical protein
MQFPGRDAWRWLLAILLAYAAITVVFTWPAATQIDRAMIGGPRDGPMFLWNTWWTARALGRGENPLWTSHLFHPEGVSRVIDTHCLLPAVLAAPLQNWFGLIPAYNLIVLFTFVLSGIGTALLVKELVGNRSAAFVAGTLFAFGHIRVSTVMFFNLIQSQWMVLAVWATLRAVRRRSIGSAVLAGVFGAALLYSSYNLLILTILFLALLVIALLLASFLRHEPIVPRLVPLGVAALVALVLSVPLLVPIAKAVISSDEAYSLAKLDSSKSYHEAVPLVRYFVRGPLRGRVDGVSWPPRQASYLGTVGIGLGFAGILYGRRRRAMWFLLATSLLFFLLSLGPRLNLRGHSLDPSSALPLLLPFHYLSGWPVLEHIREAHRFALVGWLAWSALAGFGLAGILRHCRRRWPEWTWIPPAAAILLAMAAIVDFGQWPFPQLFRLPSPPSELEAVAADPRDCAVAQFPAGRFGDPAFSWYQTRHGKPLYLDGEIARTPDALRRRMADSPLRKELGRAFHAETVSEERVPALRKTLGEEVRRNRIGWVILSWADFSTLFRERRKVPPERMETLDRFIRTLLPVDEVIYFRDPGELKDWSVLKGERRHSESSLFAIYRLDFVGVDRTDSR